MMAHAGATLAVRVALPLHSEAHPSPATMAWRRLRVPEGGQWQSLGAGGSVCLRVFTTSNGAVQNDATAPPRAPPRKDRAAALPGETADPPPASPSIRSSAWREFSSATQ